MGDQRSESREPGAAAARPAGKTKRLVGRPFVPGQSGNPAGRPAKRTATGAPGDRLPGADQPSRAMILEEAYRLVTVRDGDDEIELPANRAVFRALTAIALKGSGIAMRRWTQIVERAELEQKADQLVLHNVMERPYFGWDKTASYQDEVVFDGRMKKGVVRVLPGDGE
jgi:hypothetical protein